MIIPVQELSEEIFNEIVREFVLREGTDYGEGPEKTMDEKCQNLKAKILSGKYVITYSEIHESITVLESKLFDSSKKTA